MQFRLEDNEKEVLSGVRQTSGAVRQQAIYHPGEYISMAALSGLRGGMRRDQYTDQIWRGVGDMTMQLAGIVAAGIGAEAAGAANLTSTPQSIPEKETLGAKGPMAGVEANLTPEITNESLMPEWENESPSKTKTIVEAMARQAFPTIANAYDNGNALANSSAKIYDQTNGINRQLKDQGSLQSEIAQMLQAENPEDYDKMTDEIFNTYMAAAQEDLTKPAYQVYYKQMQELENSTRAKIVSAAGKAMFDDALLANTNLLEAAVLNGSKAEIDSIIDAGRTGAGTGVMLYGDVVAEDKRQKRYAEVDMKNFRTDLSKLGYDRALSVLNDPKAFPDVYDEDGNLVRPAITNGQREALKEEILANRDQSERDKKYRSSKAKEEIANLAPRIRSGELNLYDEMAKKEEDLLLSDKSALQAFFRTGDGPGGLTATQELTKELTDVYIDVQNQVITPQEGVEKTHNIIKGSPKDAVIPTATLMTIEEGYRNNGIMPGLDDFVKEISNLTDKDDKSLLNPGQITLARSQVYTMMGSREFLAKTPEEQSLAVNNIIAKIQETSSITSVEDAGTVRLGYQKFETKDKKSINDENTYLESLQEVSQLGGYAGIEHREINKIIGLGENGEEFFKEEIGHESMYKFLENGDWVYVDATGDEYYVRINPANSDSDKVAELVKIGSGTDTSVIHDDEGRVQNGFVAEIKKGNEIISPAFLVDGGKRIMLDMDSIAKKESPFTRDINKTFIIEPYGSDYPYEIDLKNKFSVRITDWDEYYKIGTEYYAAKQERR